MSRAVEMRLKAEMDAHLLEHERDDLEVEKRLVGQERDDFQRQLAEALDELRVGARLYAQQTDRMRELELQLSAAQADLARRCLCTFREGELEGRCGYHEEYWQELIKLRDFRNTYIGTTSGQHAATLADALRELTEKEMQLAEAQAEAAMLRGALEGLLSFVVANCNYRNLTDQQLEPVDRARKALAQPSPAAERVAAMQEYYRHPPAVRMPGIDAFKAGWDAALSFTEKREEGDDA